MTDDTIPVFVNERAVRVPRQADVLAAVRLADAPLADAFAAGDAQATDARGLPVAAADPLAPGAILRVRVSARARAGEADASP
jgi:hypothetical protein